MNYQNRVVFFFDILGFRDLIEKEYQKDQEKSEKVYTGFEFINKYYEDEIPNKISETKQITFFSDSVVISFSADEPDEIFSTIESIQILLVNLIKRGFVMRGGFSAGPLYHDSKYLFGPAFLTAYDLESKIANTPRIICDDYILYLNQKGKSLLEAEQDLEILIDIIKQDADGFWYIDYIENIESLFDTQYEHIDYLLSLYKIIIESLTENREKLEQLGVTDENIAAQTDDIRKKHKLFKNILSKYIWMKDKYNVTVNNILNNKDLEKENFDLFTYCKQLQIID